MLMIAAIVVCVAVAMTAIAFGELAATRARAASAADLAALAATAPTAGGRECDEAGRIAVAGGATLVACHREGEDFVVTASVPAPRIVATLMTATGSAAPDVRMQARAGPPACNDQRQVAGVCQSEP